MLNSMKKIMVTLALVSCGAPNQESGLKEEIKPTGRDNGLKIIYHGPSGRKYPNPYFDDYKNIWNQKLFVTTSDKREQQSKFNLTDIQADATVTELFPIAVGLKYLASVHSMHQNRNMSSRLSFEGVIAKPLEERHVYIKRLDIAPMVITRGDMSTYVLNSAKVDIAIFDQQGSTQSLLPKQFEVGPAVGGGKGLDVIDGYKYLITVSGQGEDGPKEFEQVLDFSSPESKSKKPDSNQLTPKAMQNK